MIRLKSKEAKVIEKTLMFVCALMAGTVGLSLAQGAEPVFGARPPHPRIYELKERIQSQREQITQALVNNTISVDQARICRSVLDSTENDVRNESAKNGPDMFMSLSLYNAFNSRLDVNSQFIHEKKEYYYYYGNYYDEHAYGF
jgi:hypothetical protein